MIARGDFCYRDHMFHRRQVVIENDIVARHMRKFFRALKDRHRSYPALVATTYRRLLWENVTKSLADEKLLSRSRFYVGLSTGNCGQDFERITKRATLISDTLLLSHNHTGDYHDIDLSGYPDGGPPKPMAGAGAYPSASAAAAFDVYKRQVAAWNRDHLEDMYGMYCPNIDDLGRWILDAEPPLKAGLVWYLPSYAIARYRTIGGRESLDKVKTKNFAVIDYLVRDGRAVDASGAEPIKSQLVRPVLRIDLPFIEGVNLQDFSKITIEEFTSYSAFRDFLRQSFLDMDMALNAVQSDRELLKLGLQIKDHVRSVRSQMETARRKKAVAVTGAVIGSVGAILVAVYGPALAAAVAAIGASGGMWGIIHAAAENRTRALREDKWYYVWVLAKKSDTPII